MHTKEDLLTIIGNISYPARPKWSLVLRELEDGHFYVQVEALEDKDMYTGKPYSWRARKWLLSVHMCVTEVIDTCYKAIKTAEEHELNESFTYKGVRIHNPHRSVDFLVTAGKHIHNIDTRNVRSAEV